MPPGPVSACYHARVHRTLATAIAALVLAVPASAGAASGYCSPTGDYCYSAKRVRGVQMISFGTFSFQGTVRTCVTAPGRRRSCKRLRLRESNGLYAFDVRWASHFPNRGRGTYKVTFRGAGSTLGPGVSFRRR